MTNVAAISTGMWKWMWVIGFFPKAHTQISLLFYPYILSLYMTVLDNFLFYTHHRIGSETWDSRQHTGDHMFGPRFI